MGTGANIAASIGLAKEPIRGGGIMASRSLVARGSSQGGKSAIVASALSRTRYARSPDRDFSVLAVANLAAQDAGAMAGGFISNLIEIP
jgi:hypothetical protein